MVTHAHIDHWGGAGALLEKLPNAKLMVHPRGLPHLANPERLWKQSKDVLGEIADLFGEPQPIPVGRLTLALDGLVVDLGGVEVQVVETLGHSPHHVSYFERNSRSLFPGETAGMYIEGLDAIVPATPPVIVLDKLFNSIERLITLKPEKIHYTHYGPADNAVEKLRAYDKQLRIWSETINESLRNNETLADIIERLRERDPYFNKAYYYVIAHPIIGHALNSIIQGFIVE
ncbi:MAG: MBL fold metallo-hydrolase [Nitrososphaerota archaeon]|nr:MBL fold metallo-hydrolase [Candidatus Bathyarchaeota archaeon]MDW8194517.1 MBL fold metallo-hydrolase [Nitrososphaerota archaeon]